MRLASARGERGACGRGRVGERGVAHATGASGELGRGAGTRGVTLGAGQGRQACGQPGRKEEEEERREKEGREEGREKKIEKRKRKKEKTRKRKGRVSGDCGKRSGHARQSFAWHAAEFAEDEKMVVGVECRDDEIVGKESISGSSMVKRF